MQRFLLAFLVLLVTAPAWGKPRVETSFPTTGSFIHTLTFTIGDVTPTDALGVAGTCSVVYSQASGDDVSLYAVPTATTAATSGTLIASFTASTTSPTTFEAGTLYVKAVATDATAGGSILRIHCSNTQVTRSSDADADNDGLYEAALLWDADGDGSTEVTCTAKDTASGGVTEPACKASGEVIYRDFVDDANCAIWGCGYGQMENDGTLYLKNGVVYVEWPCWEPGNTVNPSAPANDDAHDTTGDAAWSLCPATPDADTTRRFYTLALMDWQGQIVGGGTDARDALSTPNYKRDQATYLVNDMGPSWTQGTKSTGCDTGHGCNRWFGQEGFVRGINIGFQAGALNDSTAGANSGELSGDGDSKGYGTISGTVSVGLAAANQVICVANTSGLDTLVAGDIVEIKSTSGQSAFLSSKTVITALRVMATPDTGTTCNGAGTFYLAVGGRAGYLGTTGQYFGMSPPYTYQFTDGFEVVAARSDYLDARATITNLNIEPQDWWDDPTGDCSEVSTTSSGPWTQALDGDSTNVDIDCDTNPLLGLWGGGAARIEDVVIRGWHDYAIDGDSNSGSPLAHNVRFFNGHGGPIADMGSGWRFDDIDVRNSQFSTSVLSTFGPGLSVEHVRLYNVAAKQLTALIEVAVGDYFNDIKVENSALQMVYNIQAGARFNTMRHTWVSNLTGQGDTQASYNGFIARYSCTGGSSNPCEGNLIDDWYLEVAKSTAHLPTGATAVGILYDAGVTIANEATNNPGIVRNVTTNGRIRSRYTGINVCAVGALDSDTSGDASDRFRAGVPFDYLHETPLSTNIHSNLSAYASGGGGAVDLVFCGCNINKSGGGGAGWGTCEAPVGSGSVGSTPRGCGNIDASTGAAPTIGSCS